MSFTSLTARFLIFGIPSYEALQSLLCPFPFSSRHFLKHILLSLFDLRSEETCFQVYLLLIYFTSYIKRGLTKELFYILSVVEFSGEAHGVLREAWYNLNNFDLNGATMREHFVFKTPPESQIILRDFDAPMDVAEKYAQRLTSFLQVNP